MLRDFFEVPGDQYVPTPNTKGKTQNQRPAIKSGLEALEERKLLSSVTGSPTDDLIDPQATVVTIHAEQDAASEQNQQETAGNVINDANDYSIAISSITMPETAVIGQVTKGSVRVVITNDSNETPLRSDRVNLNVYARPVGAEDDSEDVLIGSELNQNLNIGLEKSRTYNISTLLPDDIDADEYIFVVIATEPQEDGLIDSVESEGTIDVQEAFVNLTGTLDDSRISTEIIEGETPRVTIPVTVTNEGNVNLDKGQKITITIVARPADAIDDSDDVVMVILENQSVSNLKAGADKTFRANFNLPADLDADDYNFVAIIDSDDVVEESDENDNEAAGESDIAVVEATRNLVGVINDSRFPEALISGDGDKISVPITITNNGNVALDKGQTIEITIVARPADAIDDSDDVVLTVLTEQKVSGLGVDKSRKINASVTLPAGLASDEYKIVAIIDSDNDLAESSELDNEAVSDAVIDVTLGQVNLTAALSETKIPTEAISGDGSTFNVKVTVTNEGNIAVAKGQKITISLFANDTLDTVDMIEIGEFLNANINGLAPGKSRTFNISASLPEGMESSDYEIVAVVDSGEVVDESDENDNDATSEAIVDVTQGVRDLTVELDDSQIPATAVSGSNTKFTIPVTITNDGNLKLAPGQKVQITVEAQRDIELNGEEGVNVPNERILILTLDNVNLSNLKPGDSKVVNLSFTLPLDDQFEDDRDYNFIVTVDSADVVEESDEENNSAVTEAVVTVTRGGPNLTADIDETDLPTEAISGSGTTIVVPVTVTNDGVTKIAAGQLVDIAIYIVEEEGEPVLLTTLEDQNIGNLNVGASKTFLANVTLPGSLEDGSYKLIAIVDPENLIVETNADDNDDLMTGTIDITQGSLDFSVEVTEESLEDFLVETAGTATITAVISNEGNLSTAADATTQVALYARLADAEDDSEDVYLTQAASVDVGALSPDGTVEVTFTDVDLSGLPVGEYVLVVLVNDAGNLNSESENSQAVTIGSFEVTLNSNDLALALIESASSDFVAGEVGEGNSLSVLVTNNGTTAVPDETSVTIALIARPVGEGESILVSLNQNVDVSELAPDGTVEVPFGELDLSDLPAGEYTLVAIVYDDDLDLASDLNNEATAEASFTVAAVNNDLALTLSESSTGDFVQGESGVANSMVLDLTNIGNIALPGETTVSISIYARPVVEGDDILVGEFEAVDVSDLGIDASVEQIAGGLDLSELPPGEYNLVAILDDSSLAQANAENNETMVVNTFTVNEIDNDLAVTLVESSSNDFVEGNSGVANTITFRVNYNGNTTIDDETEVTYTLNAVSLGEQQSVLLLAGISVDVSNFTEDDFIDVVIDDLDLSGMEPGVYVLQVIVDDSSLTNVDGDNNNVYADGAFEVLVGA